MDDGHALGRDRVGIVLAGSAMGRPTGVADAGRARERIRLEQRVEIAELALGAAALDRAVPQGGDASGIVAAVLEPPERVQEARRHLAPPDDADDAAHGAAQPPPFAFARPTRLVPGCAAFSALFLARNSTAQPASSPCRARSRASA